MTEIISPRQPHQRTLHQRHWVQEVKGKPRNNQVISLDGNMFCHVLKLRMLALQRTIATGRKPPLSCLGKVGNAEAEKWFYHPLAPEHSHTGWLVFEPNPNTDLCARGAREFCEMSQQLQNMEGDKRRRGSSVVE